MLVMDAFSYRNIDSGKIIHSSMKKIYIGLLSLTFFLVSQCKPGDDQKVLKKPNIIVILADDFGVGDIQSHYAEN
jgi:hypothetical protein